MATGTQPRPAGRPTGAALAVAIACACAASAQADVPPPPSEVASRNKPPPEPREDMTEELRAQLDTIVVVATRNAADEAVGGTYEKDTLGLAGGVSAGYEAGRIRKEVGPVPVDFRIPGTEIPGMIIGGLFGGMQREIQELRDALTEELVDAENTPLKDDGLAMDVYSRLRRVHGLTPKIVGPTTPLPDDADAVLLVHFDGVTIDVQGKEAVITTTAVASLRRPGGGAPLYRTIVRYRDRDSLRNWTENDNRLWHSYVNYTRHYLGREIAARVYARSEPAHTLAPEPTESVRRDRKDPLRFVSRTTQPELAWTLDVSDVAGTPFSETGTPDESMTWYDVEIYDRDRLVFAEEGLPEPRYTVPIELACGEYRWSVRPSWRAGGIVRYGDWMRFPPPEEESANEEGEGEQPEEPNGLSGRAASEAPAYTQDFPALAIECR